MRAVARRRLLLAGASTLLGGCGFELRRAPELAFRTIALTGFDRYSPLAQELRMQIDASQTTTVVPAVSQAQVVMEALVDNRERSVVASTAAGEVRELQLRARFQFRLLNAAGRELIAPTEILRTRDMSYRESQALAKEQEESQLFRIMQSDIVSQVMRRLAALRSI